MFEEQQTVFVLVDVQGRLAELMYERDTLFENLRKLISGMRILGVPILWAEQNPARMGATVAPVRELLEGEQPISKMSFGCCGESAFVERLEALKRKQVVMAGIETHVCIYQTACQLVERGCDVAVVAEAVSSRTMSNKQIGLKRIEACGAGLTSVETVLFELLGSAEHPRFRDVLRLVK